MPRYLVDGWFAAIGPKGMSAELVKRLHAGLVTAFNTDDVKDAMAKQGNTIQISTPDALTKQKSIAVTLIIQPGLPVIISTFPAQISVGSGDVNVTINGIRFYKDTVFRANGAAVKGNVLGITAATILLPAALFTAPGNISIVSSNPNPGGGDSTAWQLPASTNGPVIAAMTNAASYSPSIYLHK